MKMCFALTVVLVHVTAVCSAAKAMPTPSAALKPQASGNGLFPPKMPEAAQVAKLVGLVRAVIAGVDAFNAAKLWYIRFAGGDRLVKLRWSEYTAAREELMKQYGPLAGERVADLRREMARKYPAHAKLWAIF